jgi:CMP-N-acetylneuraminic acid synthetase
VVVLEPTSPLRRPAHVREAAGLLGQADSVASVSAVPHHYVPQKVVRIRDDGMLEALDGTHPRDLTHRRQDLPTHYAFDGLIFACTSDVVRSEPPTLWGDRVLGMRVESRYAVDLDRPEDWAPAEERMRAILAEEAG